MVEGEIELCKVRFIEFYSYCVCGSSLLSATPQAILTKFFRNLTFRVLKSALVSSYKVNFELQGQHMRSVFPRSIFKMFKTAFGYILELCTCLLMNYLLAWENDYSSHDGSESISVLSPASGLLKRAYQPYYTEYAIIELQQQVQIYGNQKLFSGPGYLTVGYIARYVWQYSQWLSDHVYPAIIKHPKGDSYSGRRPLCVFWPLTLCRPNLMRVQRAQGARTLRRMGLIAPSSLSKPVPVFSCPGSSIPDLGGESLTATLEF